MTVDNRGLPPKPDPVPHETQSDRIGLSHLPGLHRNPVELSTAVTDEAIAGSRCLPIERVDFLAACVAHQQKRIIGRQTSPLA